MVQKQPVESDYEMFDTIIVPARSDGFLDTFLAKNCWHAVRINAKNISKLKHIAAYQVAPIAAITHIAVIESIVPYSITGWYQINFKGAATSIGPISRLENNKVNMQSPRYALREKLLVAKSLDAVWS